MKRLGALLLCCWCLWLPAAEVLPPKPTRHFNDYARVVPAATADQFNRRLEQFERDTSNQIVVAVFPKLTTGSSLEDFTQRVATAWQVGQKSRNNGAVLFVFVQDRALRIVVGYGLEGTLPDALCKRIIADEITPHFRSQNYAAGLAAGIDALLAATRGEYTGTGRTATRANRSPGPNLWLVGGVLALVILLTVITRGSFLWWLLQALMSSNRSYSRRGSSWSGGGSWGGGGFSGGGGSFGGGGASGRW